MRNHGVRQALHVVGRQVLVFGADMALKEAPGVTRQVVHVVERGRVQAGFAAAQARLADEPGPQPRQAPHQQQDCSRDHLHRRAQSAERGQGQPEARCHGRHAHMLAHQHRQLAAGRSLRGRRSGPLQQPAA